MSELSNKIDQVRNILRTDDGISGAMDYTQAISWVLFLKFLDDYEQQNSKEAFLENRDYKFIIDAMTPFWWHSVVANTLATLALNSSRAVCETRRKSREKLAL